MSDITREDAVKWLTNLRDDCGRYQDLWHYAEALDQIIKLFDADVAPVRHGHWDRQKNKQVCSLCGAEWYYHENDVDMFGFCPNCGARMDGEDNEID